MPSVRNARSISAKNFPCQANLLELERLEENVRTKLIKLKTRGWGGGGAFGWGGRVLRVESLGLQESRILGQAPHPLPLYPNARLDIQIRTRGFSESQDVLNFKHKSGPKMLWKAETVLKLENAGSGHCFLESQGVLNLKPRFGPKMLLKAVPC